MPELAAVPTRDVCVARDARDPLAPCRDLFHLPAGRCYFDGNSLGPLPRATRQRLQQVVETEWGEDLIAAWNRHGWIDLPRRVGAKIAPLVGAAADEVVVTDSVSINLFKLLAAGLALRPGRRVILSEAEQFPTDLYMIQGLAGLLDGQAELRLVAAAELEAGLDEDVAIVCLSHVRFRTGALLDMAALTRAAHAHGALVLFDLSHSVGAMPIDLPGCGVDLAVGCGYKFLNGGPGAPAFVYVPHRWQAVARSPLQGWLGHARPFDFDLDYAPAAGIDRFQCGTPPILSLAALDAALDVFATVDLGALRRKSEALGDLLLALVDARCRALDIACPADAAARGSQVCLRHPEGYGIVQALIDRGVVADFRAPDVLRFGLAPLYLRYTDVWDAVNTLCEVLTQRAWDDPRFARRGVVT